MTHRNGLPLFLTLFAGLIIVLGVNAYRRPAPRVPLNPDPLPALNSEIAELPYALQIFRDIHVALRKVKTASQHSEWFRSGYQPGEVFSNVADLKTSAAWGVLCQILGTLPAEDLVYLENDLKVGKWHRRLKCAENLLSSIQKFYDVRSTRLQNRPLKFASTRLDVIARPAQGNTELAPTEVNLSFDAGPHPQRTARILDLLKQEGVRANFFLRGDHARDFPELLHRIEAEGHIIGSQTQHHKLLTVTSMRDAEEEIQQGRKTLETILNHPVTLFRFPFNEDSVHLCKVIKALGLIEIPWDQDSHDWQLTTPEAVLHELSETLKRGGSVVLRDANEHAVQALPYFLDELKARSRKIVVFTPH